MIDTNNAESIRVSLPGIDSKLVDKFIEFHLTNQAVFEKFKTLASLMRGRGRPKYSAWVIVNKIRWDYDIDGPGGLFKINNDFIALYSRLLIASDNSFSDFFELRSMKPNDRRSSDEERYRAARKAAVT